MCIVASVLALLVLLGADTSMASPTNGDKKNVMIVLKDVQSLLRVKAMCAYTTPGFKIKAATLGMDDDCHMPHLCKRVYSRLFSGFSGALDAQDLARVQRCLPRAISYEEEDAKVQKLEGKHRSNPYWLGNTSAYGDGVSSFSGMSQQYYFKEDNPDIVKGFGKGQKQYQDLTLQWNLDRVDQRELPLDRKYKHVDSASTGKGVTVYVLDSGARMTHQEFTGRISSGFDFVDEDEDASDCDGHGSHVAATAAGKGVGLAKDADIVAVRILDCNGDGSVSDTVAALDWVAEHAEGPSVVVLSLGIEGPSSGSRILEEATKSLVRNYGITTVVASGNTQQDACYVSPANVPDVITVAASDIPNKFESNATQEDVIYYWGNLGVCVDIFAPGVDIYSACGSEKRCNKLSDSAYTLATGTSMAAPSVAGAAAVYLEKHPHATPLEVKEAIIERATSDAINEAYFPPSLFLKGTPNKMLYVQ